MTDTKDEIAAAKEVIRELHEAIQGAREAKRELEAAWRKVRTDIDDQIEAEVTSAINDMTDQVMEAIELSTKKVYERFDGIVATMLGEKPSQRRRGVPTVPELIETAAQHGHKIRLTKKEREDLESVLNEARSTE